MPNDTKCQFGKLLFDKTLVMTSLTFLFVTHEIVEHFTPVHPLKRKSLPLPAGGNWYGKQIVKYSSIIRMVVIVVTSAVPGKKSDQ